MTLKEAEEIMEKYEDNEDKSCTCWQNSPCSRCENCPPKDLYEEAQNFIEIEKQKAIKKLDELLEHELGDYCFKWEIDKDRIEFYEGSFFINVDYYMYDYEKSSYLSFKIDEEIIAVCKYEDVYEEIDVYEPSIKHLWMLVKWD